MDDRLKQEQEYQRRRLIELVKGQISGDGTIWGRMNAVEGGKEYLDEQEESRVKRLAEVLQEEGFTVEQVEAEMRRRFAAADAGEFDDDDEE